MIGGNCLPAQHGSRFPGLSHKKEHPFRNVLFHLPTENTPDRGRDLPAVPPRLFSMSAFLSFFMKTSQFQMITESPGRIGAARRWSSSVRAWESSQPNGIPLWACTPQLTVLFIAFSVRAHFIRSILYLSSPIFIAAGEFPIPFSIPAETKPPPPSFPASADLPVHKPFRSKVPFLRIPDKPKPPANYGSVKTGILPSHFSAPWPQRPPACPPPGRMRWFSQRSLRKAL